MKRLLLLLALTACTPAQLEAWQAWYVQDPQAAIAFAELPVIQEYLRLDWDRDGVVEPEPSIESLNDSIEPQDSGESINEAPRVSGGSVWDALAACESGGNWSISSGFYEGGVQFAPSTWDAYGGEQYAEHAYDASREQQIDIAERVLDDVGWGAWPTCSRRIGVK